MENRKRLPVVLVFILVFGLACQCSLPPQVQDLLPESLSPSEPLPPQVIQTMPERNEEQGLQEPLQLVFDQAMDAETVEAAFSIQPPVAGAIEWPTPRVMQFKPAGEGFDRATRYTVTIKEEALSARDLPLDEPVSLYFTTVGYLEVSAVQPADGTTEVALDGTVTVLFNRPVVGLVAIEDQDDLPQPLSFDPPVEGTGEWLNTSIYLFTPDEEGFAPATTYTAEVAAGLTDTTGGVLAEDFTWEFTTVLPAVVGTYPDADTTYVSPEPTIYVAFNQSMDRASTEDAFVLVDPTTGDPVEGTFEWHAEGLILPSRRTYEPYQWSWGSGTGPERVGVETMGFTPDQPLDFGTRYLATVKADAQGATGSAGTTEAYSWRFETIQYPRIVETYPANGARDADPWGGLEITFSSPMDPETLEDNFTISPPVSPTEVYTYWWSSDTRLEISFPIEPSSDYEVTIGGDVSGRYGHPLGDPTTVRWSTRPLNPLVYLHTVDRVTTYNAYTRTLATLTVRNVGRVEFSLYRMPVADFLRANGRNGWDYWDGYQGAAGQLVREWSMDVSPVLNQRAIYATKLAESEDGLLEPGLYFLKVEADYEAIYPQAFPEYYQISSKQMLVVSRHNLSVKTASVEKLAWLTDLSSGDVLPGVPVTVMSEEGEVLAKGTTDGEGVFQAGHPRVEQWTPIFVFAGDPDDPGPDFAAAISNWDDGVSRWDFDLPTEDYEETHAGYLFTDRPIYRPGQTVYFKGIVRADYDAHYTLPQAGDEVLITIWDAQGTEILEDVLSLNDMGTLNGQLDLDEEASLGNYTLRATYPPAMGQSGPVIARGEPGNLSHGRYDVAARERVSRGPDGEWLHGGGGIQYFYTSFQVAEYRKPEFQVEVQTDRPEVAHGDEINVTAQATYFFGGPVADAEVRYAVLSTDHYFDYRGPGRWTFGEREYGWWWRWRSQSVYGERIADGTGTTDAQGRFTFSVEADVAEEITSQRLTLEVTVTDVNNQEVSNRTEAIVHKGTYYVGLRPERYVGSVDEENRVELITVDWDSEPVSNREVTVIFAKRKWYSVQKKSEGGDYYWESVVEDEPVYTTTVTTDADGEAVVGFTPEEGGSYKVIGLGVDEKGNQVRSATYTWISGRGYVSWGRENNDRIELVADKQQYQVGDSAVILIPHPYQGPVKALITVERAGVYDYQVRTLESNSEQIAIPITEDLIPNVFVSVVIVKGVDENNPVPSFKVGYVRLPIETTEKELTIRMTPDRSGEDHYQPGETVNYDVEVTDSAGRPVEAELALNLVDLAVLTLADRPGPDIVDTFWRERGLGVSTASGLTLSGDRITEELGEEIKGLGGGGGGEEFGPVRKRFPDLAYWDPTLRTGEDGRAQVSVELPDNLTTWRMGAHGVTAGTLVGQAQVDIVSTKDLLVRSVAPRFFVVGDEAELAAVVHNNTAEPLEVTVALEAGGLTLGADERQSVTIPADDKVKVTWPVEVNDTSQTVLRFGARAGDLADAMEITLPVYRYSAPEVVATAGTLAADGQRVEAVALPLSYDPTQGELSIHLDPSLAAGMADGLEYLEHYPYECTEQTVSRFLPNVVTYRAFEELGLERPDLEKQLPGLVNQGLQRLYNQQHFDGGWGWWVRGRSKVYLTAYVLLGMVEADRAGFTVDEERMEMAVTYLQNNMVRSRDLEKHWKANQQAFVLYVLAEAGEGEVSRAVSLFERRDSLDTFGRAYLAMALALLEPDEPARVNTLLADITSAAVVSATGAHWEEEQVDYYSMNTDTRSTAIVLAALSRLDPDHALGPNTVRWLMVARKDGYWETTQETAWAILGLTDWMVATGELEGAYNWHVVVNRDEVGSGSVDQDNVDEKTELQVAVADLLAEEANRVVLERWAPEGQEAGTGRLYYGLYLRYFKPVEEVTALNRGIIVSRRYTPAACDPQEGPCPVVEQAEVGDSVRVKLTIIAPHDLHYVVVEDPFPAGAEGVDLGLETTSVAGEAPEMVRTDRYDWWGGYGWWWFDHTEMRDEKMVLFASYLPAGTYEYTYYVRPSLTGEFRVIPTHAYEMYFPEVFGRGDGGVFTITE